MHSLSVAASASCFTYGGNWATVVYLLYMHTERFMRRACISASEEGNCKGTVLILVMHKFLFYNKLIIKQEFVHQVGQLLGLY